MHRRAFGRASAQRCPCHPLQDKERPDGPAVLANLARTQWRSRGKDKVRLSEFATWQASSRVWFATGGRWPPEEFDIHDSCLGGALVGTGVASYYRVYTIQYNTIEYVSSLAGCANAASRDVEEESNAGQESADHHVRPAQPRDARLLWPSGRANAEPRSPRGARHPLHLVLDTVAGLHSCKGLVRDRQVHPPDRFLGQRRSLRRVDPELASPAARCGSPYRLDRQASLPFG